MREYDSKAAVLLTRIETWKQQVESWPSHVPDLLPLLNRLHDEASVFLGNLEGTRTRADGLASRELGPQEQWKLDDVTALLDQLERLEVDDGPVAGLRLAIESTEKSVAQTRSLHPEWAARWDNVNQSIRAALDCPLYERCEILPRSDLLPFGELAASVHDPHGACW